ncbi:MAG: lipid-A-disaccharide synthase [Terracidiphilus sp.]|jgi:lipid-A-disaccharide synthase
MPQTIFISAGEASGEHYGALVIAALKKQLAAAGQSAEFFGMGGERMATAGLDCVVRSEDMAVMGLTEVVRHLPRIWREFRKLKKSIRVRRPSLAILIDFPEIHFRLAKQLHQLGVPVLYFVSPQLWAWKKHRIKLVRKYIDRMLVIFPFEEPFYRSQGVQAEFVGHPLAESALPDVSREYFAMCNYLQMDRTWIALLPGSRAREIHDNLPHMLAAARQLAARQPCNFMLPLAPTLTSAGRRMAFDLIRKHAHGIDVRCTPGALEALFFARASIVASGTATVEAALAGNPFVVVYRVSPLTYAIAKRIVTVPHVAMVNLIAGKRVVPELIQSECTSEHILREIVPLLPDGPPRQSMMEELARIRSLLMTHPANGVVACGAIDRVAAVALELLKIESL